MPDYFDAICSAGSERLKNEKSSLRCGGSGNANPIMCRGCPYVTTMYGVSTLYRRPIKSETPKKRRGET